MRQSPKRHNLARLRLYLKLSQKELAEICGCSVHTIQSIELVRPPRAKSPRLALSEDLAQRIASETGVSLRWLLDNNLKAPIVAPYGPSPKWPGWKFQGRYTFKHYELAQASKIKLSEAANLSEVETFATNLESDLRGILFSAKKRGQLQLAIWKISKFLREYQKQFGYDSRIAQKHREELLAAHRRKTRQTSG